MKILIMISRLLLAFLILYAVTFVSVTSEELMRSSLNKVFLSAFIYSLVISPVVLGSTTVQFLIKKFKKKQWLIKAVLFLIVIIYIIFFKKLIDILIGDFYLLEIDYLPVYMLIFSVYLPVIFPRLG